MIVLPFLRRIARVGSGVGLLLGSVLVKYCQTTLSFWSTSTIRLLFESVISVSPFDKRLAKATPLTVPRAVKVATMFRFRSTSIARLLFSSAINMWPLSSSSALFVELIGPVPRHSGRPILPHDLLLPGDLDDPL